MKISAIVACAEEHVIGLNNQIPWYLPADLAYFKKITSGHHILMGRNCFESIGKPLPKRTNIVITRNPFFMASGCLVAHSIQEAIALARENGETEAFIIGGGEIYQQSVHLWDKLYYTEVDLKTEGDVFFPEIAPRDWRLVSEEVKEPDEKNAFRYTFKVYEKLKLS
jgi:dihydrofolate reductase